MSTIKEIMWAAEDFAFSAVDCHSHLSDESDEQRCDLLRGLLRDQISAAIADARREGAEQMREAAASEFDRRDGGTGIGFYDPHEPAEIVRALPLTTGLRRAVRLTDEQVERLMWCNSMGPVICSGSPLLEYTRTIETAVLAANGIGDGDA